MSYEINIPGGAITAKSYRELVARLEHENDFWQSIGNFSSDQLASDGHKLKWLNTFTGGVNNILNFWETKTAQLNQQDGRNIKDFFPDFKASVEESLEVPPESSSAVARYIKNCVSREDRSTAFAVLLATKKDALNVERSFGNNQQVAMASYWGFAQGIAAAVAKESAFTLSDEVNAEVEREISVTESMIATIGNEILDAQSDHDALQTKVSNAEEYANNRFKTLHGRAVRSIRSVLSKNRAAEEHREERFSSMLDAFEVHLRLKRPVTLWSERKSEHEAASIQSRNIFFAGSALFVLTAIGVVVCFGDWVAAAFVKEGCVLGTEALCSGISAKGPLAVSVIVAVSTVWLWFLRLQLRIFLSERHLVLDARERMAFAETYLSLLKGQNVSREHEAVVLQSLFRPTQDGIIKDDLGPDSSMAGLLAKALDRRQG